jgi:hypothetical protein
MEISRSEEAIKRATVKFWINERALKIVLKEALRKYGMPKPMDKIDILVIDECQDMTPLFYKFVQKFMYDMNNDKLQLLVLGDHMQGVYGHNDADIRYLTKACNIWRSNMKTLSLSYSYRVTKPMAWFVNNMMLGRDCIKSDRDGPVIDYICTSLYKCSKAVIDFIKEMLTQGYNYVSSYIYKGPNNIRKSNELLASLSWKSYYNLDNKTLYVYNGNRENYGNVNLTCTGFSLFFNFKEDVIYHLELFINTLSLNQKTKLDSSSKLKTSLSFIPIKEVLPLKL